LSIEEKKKDQRILNEKKAEKLTGIFTSVDSAENSNVRTCPAVPATISVSVLVQSDSFCMAKRGSSQ
jgi:hypothetical protein